MIGDIKPIETEYGGYKFRSRLEARWAVFFDEMGISYEYESEGFVLSCGWYLPDFWLPDFHIYVEVKPNPSGDVASLDKWRKKCDVFRTEVGKAILLCKGDPAEETFHDLFAWDTCDSGGGEYDSYAVFKGYHDKPYLFVDDYRPDRLICINDGFGCSELVVAAYEYFQIKERDEFERFVSREMYEKFDPHATDMLNSAKKKARQARFELGETPLASRRATYAPSTPDIEALEEMWSKAMDAIRAGAPDKADLLAASRPTSVRGDAVMVGLPAGSDFQASVLRMPMVTLQINAITKDALDGKAPRFFVMGNSDDNIGENNGR